MTPVILGVVAIPLLVAAHDMIRRPVLRRQAVRNVVRRPSESLIMIGGALLGTAIITASFIIGDTFDGSIRDIARTNLGPIDEVVVTDDRSTAQQIAADLAADPIEGTDGVLVAVGADVTISTVDSGQGVRAEPSAAAFELDFDSARSFGQDPTITGFSELGGTPGPGQATVSRPLATTLGVTTGDSLVVHAYGITRTVEVIAVANRLGVAGRTTDNVHLIPGTLDAMWQEAGNADLPMPTGFVYISNEGGVFDSVDNSEAVLSALSARLAMSPGVDSINDWKADLLRDAEAEGTELTTIFSSIGSFAVLSGILLVVNIVVMLTDERRSQLGIMRALGVRRSQVVRIMGLEGTFYAIASTAAGVSLGIGVGWIVGYFSNTVVQNDGLSLSFQFETSSLVTAGAIGLLVTLATVWLSSIRLARMNVISAIRDLPSPQGVGRSWLRDLAGLGAAALGAFLLYLGVTEDSAMAAMTGVPILAVGLIPTARRLVGWKAATSLAGLGAVIWGIAVFTVLPDAMRNPEINIFVLQGVVLVTGSVMALTANEALWRRIIDLSGRGRAGVPIRLGMTYPLARPGRTGLLVAMYSLVLFTISFMAIITAVFDEQGPAIVDQTSAGFDIIVDSNRTNPVDETELNSIDGVSATAALNRIWLDVVAPGSDQTLPVTGIDESFLTFGGPELQSMDPRYVDADDLWRAVISDSSKVVVGEFTFGDDADEVLSVGDELTIFSDVGAGRQRVTVAAVLQNDWMYNGVLTGAASVDALVDGSVIPTRFYVSTAAGLDPGDFAARLNGELLSNGAEARSFLAEVSEELDGSSAFIRILQAYLGIGLLIGVAGLGIVLVRAVRERRREIGMLRAIGFTSTTIRRAFLVEALFIAGQGAILGVGLGIVTGWQVVTQADAFDTGASSLVIPKLLMAGILFGPIVASLMAAALPAKRAAEIAPAVALRVTG
ncbi:MAG: FtsX-like permease family protein [Actinobacteria bacterium]|nr:FtsX-like permease family protein [Actinomycetota bacterium]